MLHNMGYETRVRPVLQTNFSLDDGSPMFISTDTVGLSADHSHVQLYGRVLGITPQMRESASSSTWTGNENIPG